MIYSLSAPISPEWENSPFICSWLIEDGRLLLNAWSSELLLETLLSRAYLSFFLSDYNALFDLFVHMILSLWKIPLYGAEARTQHEKQLQLIHLSKSYSITVGLYEAEGNCIISDQTVEQVIKMRIIFCRKKLNVL